MGPCYPKWVAPFSSLARSHLGHSHHDAQGTITGLSQWGHGGGVGWDEVAVVHPPSLRVDAGHGGHDAVMWITSVLAYPVHDERTIRDLARNYLPAPSE